MTRTICAKKMHLQCALTQLRSDHADMPAGLLNDFAEIPRRGRRRKVGGMVEA